MSVEGRTNTSIHMHTCQPRGGGTFRLLLVRTQGFADAEALRGHAEDSARLRPSTARLAAESHKHITGISPAQSALESWSSGKYHRP